MTPTASNRTALGDTVLAVAVGMGVMLAGTLPRNFLFAVNLKLVPSIPWSVPLTAVYLWFFWRYLKGSRESASTTNTRRSMLRANPVSAQAWLWSLTAGVLGIIALVVALQLVNLMMTLPPQTLPDMSGVSQFTQLSLLLFAAPVAGLIEESAFRGFMQRPIEQRYGLVSAVLITGTMFAVAHLDFTPVLWPYYVLVSALYGTIAYLCESILPSMLLHTIGNLYSNLDLYVHGRAEWQAPASQSGMLWTIGPDRAFWISTLTLVVAVSLTIGAFQRLAAATQQNRKAVPLLIQEIQTSTSQLKKPKRRKAKRKK